MSKPKSLPHLTSVPSISIESTKIWKITRDWKRRPSSRRRWWMNYDTNTFAKNCQSQIQRWDATSYFPHFWMCLAWVSQSMYLDIGWYRVCHGSRLTKPDDYLWDTLDQCFSTGGPRASNLVIVLQNYLFSYKAASDFIKYVDLKVKQTKKYLILNLAGRNNFSPKIGGPPSFLCWEPLP